MMDNQTLKQALKVGMLPYDFVRLKKRIVEEAVRLAESPHAVDYRTDSLYFVTPIIYRVQKVEGEWICSCSRYRRLRFCEHSLAVELKEGEGST